VRAEHLRAPSAGAAAREVRPRARPRRRASARAGRGAAHASAEPLASLPVRRVPTAPAAVLLELHPVGRVPLRLLRLIVPPLALGAGERDCDSDSGCHFSFPLKLSLRRLTHRARAAAW